MTRKVFVLLTMMTNLRKNQIPHKTQKKFPKPKQSPKKFHKNKKSPPPACIFSDLRRFFLLYFGRGLEKNLQISSAKDIFCAIILIVFEFAWQTNGKFGTEFAIRLLRQAKSESARRNEFAYFYERTYDEKIISTHHTCAF